MLTKEARRLYDQERYQKNRADILVQKKEYYKRNSKKISKSQKERREKNAEDIRKRNREYNITKRIYNKYGITIEDYDKMFESQHGACAICGGMGKLAIDHDHKTGIVRGLLCYKCNTGIGMLKDDMRLLASAMTYLKNFEVR